MSAIRARRSSQAVFQENRTTLPAARSSLTMRPSRSVMRRDARLDSAGVVRHQHQRGSFALVERDQQFQHMLAVLRVEIAGGLVGQQNRRTHHERASQGDALLLAAGKLDRVMIAAIEQADAFEQFARALGTVDAIAAGQFIRQQNVLFSGQCGQQMIGLKHEADFAAAQQRHAVFVRDR